MIEPPLPVLQMDPLLPYWRKLLESILAPLTNHAQHRSD
jgi:hypothetical protein